MLGMLLETCICKNDHNIHTVIASSNGISAETARGSCEAKADVEEIDQVGCCEAATRFKAGKQEKRVNAISTEMKLGLEPNTTQYLQCRHQRL